MNKFFIATLALSIVSCATSPLKKTEISRLEIKTEKETRAFTREELLKSPDVKQIVVTNSPDYPSQTQTYTAVPVASLFNGLTVHKDQVLLFKCLDGFAANLSTERVLNTNPKKSIAYIAIEDPHAKWPLIKKSGSPSAGPFYLVWENPEKSKIVPEEWPYQLAGFELKPSVAEQFPLIVPNAKSSLTTKAGYSLFVKNCFACHTMNEQGSSQLGPDLNRPHNPTQYLGEKYLRMLIRNPQDLRHWPQSKMPSFAKNILSDEEVNAIIAYLKQMNTQRLK